MPRHLTNFIGKRFGRLLVVEQAESANEQRRWVCQCDCGKQKILPTGYLTSGITKSCGCLRREATLARNRTHGLSKSREYQVWNMMIQRCTNEKQKSFADYGGRGIKVCDRWRESFEAFIADMGSRPSDKHSIERRDGNGDYCPENCYWADDHEQTRNKKNNRWLTHDGKTLIIADWARLTGIRKMTIARRIDELGWSVHDALTKPAGKQGRHK